MSFVSGDLFTVGDMIGEALPLFTSSVISVNVRGKCQVKMSGSDSVGVRILFATEGILLCFVENQENSLRLFITVLQWLVAPDYNGILCCLLCVHALICVVFSRAE